MRKRFRKNNLDKLAGHAIIGTDKALMRPVAYGTVQREAGR